jgi:transposase-like protein
VLAPFVVRRSGPGAPTSAIQKAATLATDRLQNLSKNRVDSRRDRQTLASAAREELTRLRREDKRLQLERDILEAAANFFAKKSQ